MTINKGKLLKTVGWATVGVGLYIVVLGSEYDVELFFDKTIKPDDNIIDAEFKIID